MPKSYQQQHDGFESICPFLPLILSSELAGQALKPVLWNINKYYSTQEFLFGCAFTKTEWMPRGQINVLSTV